MCNVGLMHILLLCIVSLGACCCTAPSTMKFVSAHKMHAKEVPLLTLPRSMIDTGLTWAAEKAECTTPKTGILAVKINRKDNLNGEFCTSR